MNKANQWIDRQLAYFLLTLSVLLVSCDRREITYYMESEITIEADWSNSALSDAEQRYGSTAVFFPQTGGEPKIVLMGDRTQQKVRLAAGIYDVVLFNRSYEDFGAVTFDGFTFTDFRAAARKVETRIDPETRATTRVIVQTPEEVSTDAFIGFEVTEAMLGNYSEEAMVRMKTRSGSDTRAEEDNPERYVLRLAPTKLTQRVNITLHITGLQNVHHVIGNVNGVSESTTLYNRELQDETVTQQFILTDITFDEGSPFVGVMKGTFNVFGLDCSELNKINLTFYLVDGKTVVDHDFESQITHSQRPDGTLEYTIELTPPKLPDVKPTEGEDAGFDVDVDEWGDPEDVDVPM